ncbi:MAG TPA: haloacid dehalogenase-like hydrolase [Conexibacter sp.]|nr:haloacid dehalogenase-like hydrolase [Conexibacter sp.]
MLLLFDIDGTLVGGATEAHRDALHEALLRVHGIADPSAGVQLDPAGRTDPEIARLLLLGNGVPARRIDERAADVRIATCEAYARRVPGDLSHTVLPGVVELLGELAARDEHRLALLTGNYEPVARLKLRSAGIGDRFPARQGAFGSDAEERALLPAIARGRAGANGGDAGAPYPRERTLVIGDTPRDVACAHADGVRCFAVATGRFGAEALRAAGADAVAESAREIPALLDALA